MLVFILLLFFLYPPALAKELKYKVGDCAAYSEFGEIDRVWQVVKIGKKQYAYKQYGTNEKLRSEDFDYFEKFIAPFKRECGKK